MLNLIKHCFRLIVLYVMTMTILAGILVSILMLYNDITNITGLMMFVISVIAMGLFCSEERF